MPKLGSIEETLIEEFRNANSLWEGRIFAEDFGKADFNPEQLIEICSKEESQKLGYLAEWLVRNVSLPVLIKQRLTTFYKNIRPQHYSWKHFVPSFPEIQDSVESGHRSDLENKWKIYPPYTADDANQWFRPYGCRR